ncbi:hypothetical protein NPIL_373911 [Nephila pilipes]|uniref:Uncharacterized protein n=1 Tax=Nephila pilipes TaxID=299642 RepID=A0A8X6P0D4_NEPPI|nr:hypothetical protein NPIL_373911 [Nephila pilipes]
MPHTSLPLPKLPPIHAVTDNYQTSVEESLQNHYETFPPSLKTWKEATAAGIQLEFPSFPVRYIDSGAPRPNVLVVTVETASLQFIRRQYGRCVLLPRGRTRATKNRLNVKCLTH